MPHLSRAGDLVRVPLAFGHVQGTIVQILGDGAHASAVVEVPVHGAWGEELDTETVSYPVAALERIDAPGPARS